MVQADFANALRDREEIKITVKGRRSGREVTLPVWFALEGKTLWLLPLHGSRTQWLRNVLADPTLTLRAGGRAVAPRAGPGGAGGSGVGAVRKTAAAGGPGRRGDPWAPRGRRAAAGAGR